MVNIKVESIQRALEASSKKVPGLSAMVSSRDETLYKGHFGYLDLEGKKLVDDNSLFRIASMTKAVTSTCIMQLIEEGKLSLETELKHFFPEVSSKKIIEGFDNKDQPIYSEPSNDILIKHLLSHSSGLGYEMWNKNISKLVEKGDLVSMMTNKRDFLDAPLLFNPGSSWEYGIGIDWLGVLVEEISGLNLQEYMKKNIFDPLEMRDTGYDLPSTEHARVAKVYSRSEDSFSEIPFGVSEKYDFYSGGGGLISSIHDYSAFLKIFLNAGKENETQILKKESVEVMLTSLNREMKMKNLETSSPPLTEHMIIMAGTEKSWSPGFMINHDTSQSGRPEDSAGWAGLFNSYFWIDTQNKLVSVILMQMLPFLEKGCVETLEHFEASIYKDS
jgi:CubicO group peptidase (beta-lactamase class C family)